jgi:hypothetical protein
MKVNVETLANEYIRLIEEKFNLNFNFEFGYVKEDNEYYIYHNSSKLEKMEKENSKQAKELLNCFFEVFYENNIFNIHLGYKPKVFNKYSGFSKISDIVNKRNEYRYGFIDNSIAENYDLGYRRYREIA